MRVNSDHMPQDNIDIADVLSHLAVEFKTGMFLNKLVRNTASTQVMFYMVDLVKAAYPEEFTGHRLSATKAVLQRLYDRFQNPPPIPVMCHILHENGMPVTQIAQTLSISRNTTHYHLKRERVQRPHCILTYGEFDLLLDFLDLWESFYKGEAPNEQNYGPGY